MKILAGLISAALVFGGCTKHKSHDTQNPIDQVIEKRNFYVQEILNLDDLSKLFVKRCDSLTFKALLAAFVEPELVDRLSIFDHEWSSGEWHRDVADQICFPHDSKSEISRDSFIMLFHYLWSIQDFDALKRIYDYGYPYWHMGVGPHELTTLLPLVPTLNQMLEEYAGNFSLRSNPISGFRGHLLALYVYLQGRIKGYINDAEIALLVALNEESPGNPIYNALLNRYHDGQQDNAINALLNDTLFPTDKLPLTEANFSWGSAPDAVTYIVTVAILEGM